MKTKLNCFFLALTLIAGIHQAVAQGTVFAYQGRLSDGGQPANGTNYGMVFYLYDAPAGGTVLGDLGIVSVTVSNGLFTTPLDFGSQFDGTPRWLEISVQKNGGAFTTLSPRQPILPVPYAIFANTAGNLSGTVSLGQLPGAVLTNYQSDASLNGTFTGNGNYLTNLNPQNLASGNVGAQLFFTNQFNFFNGGFNGYHSGDGHYLTNLDPQNLASGNVGAQLFFTNQFNFFNGGFNGYHSGDGHYLTNLNPQNLASGNVGAQLFFTNQFNFFNGGFNGYHSGDGNYLTNLNPQNLASGNVGAQLFFTNQFNFFNGGFNGYHSGDGHYLANLDPQNLASGNVGAQLFFTNQFNFFNGGFSGYHNGDGSGLTNVSVNGITGGLNINITVLVPGGTNILCFTNGILRDIK